MKGAYCFYDNKPEILPVYMERPRLLAILHIKHRYGVVNSTSKCKFTELVRKSSPVVF